MRPALLPGDWLLVDPDVYRHQPPAAGEVVVVADPRRPERLLVKRIAAVLSDGRLELHGDAGEASTDSRTFGPIGREALVGRAWARYWPLRRAGPIR